jgi:hypothetical protein
VASDLPGYSVAPPDAGGGGGSSGCPALDTDPTSGSSASAGRLFQVTKGGPYIREQLAQFSDQGAAGVLATIGSALRGCTTFVGNVPPYGTVHFTVTPFSTPNRGDGTVAMTLTMKPESYALTIYENLVMFRHGGTVISITHTAVTSIDDAMTNAAAAHAYDRVAALW